MADQTLIKIVERDMRRMVKKSFEEIPPELKCLFAVTLLRVTKEVCQEEYDAGMEYCDEQLEDCSATEPDMYLQIVKLAVLGVIVIGICIELATRMS